MDKQKNKVNCMKCKYYYVTWDKEHPRGCKIFGFKTKKMPSVLVYESSGQECMNFTKK